MTDDLEDWAYGNLGMPRKPLIDVARILKGDGFDDPDDPFQESEADHSRPQLNPCACNLEQFRVAGEALYKFLTKSPQHFPTNDNQLESFRAIGGYASGKWRDWVDVERSTFESSTGSGFILLSRRCEKKHTCWITLEHYSTVNLFWRGKIESVLGIAVDELYEPNSLPNNDKQGVDFSADDQTFQDPEKIEETKYDIRTFGALEPEDSHSDPTIDRWLEAGFESKEAEIFIKNKIDLEDVFELMRFMPDTEVTKWVLKFKKKSIDALELLKLSHSDKIEKLDIENKKFDIHTADLSEAIRDAVQANLRKWIKDKKTFRKRGL